MKTLKLDISKAGVEITPRMEERTREALSLLYSKQGARRSCRASRPKPGSCASVPT